VPKLENAPLYAGYFFAWQENILRNLYFYPHQVRIIVDSKEGGSNNGAFLPTASFN
jgi:hypothetical protein